MPLVARSISEITDRISESIDSAFSRRSMRALGDYMVKLIRDRTRRGGGVRRDMDNVGRLKKLSPRYVRYRKGFRGLSGFTSPSKSNVTLTGNMLAQFKAIQSRDGTVRLGFRRRKEGQKAMWTHEQGRPWANVSRGEYNKTVKYADRALGRSFRAHRL